MTRFVATALAAVMLAGLAVIPGLAQDKPLYHNFTVGEMLRFGARLNPGWDRAVADHWRVRFDLPPDRRVGHLSSGQRTQLAVALALAKRPRLLLLDEPMADLDPLVRHDLTRLLMETVAADGLTVVFSSHVLAELATVCDYLVLLVADVRGVVVALPSPRRSGKCCRRGGEWGGSRARSGEANP